MIDADQRAVLKRNLKKTWPVFFGRFGRLLPIQEMAIPVIMKGRNAIITSPTASGKTEAVLAPIAEKLLNEKAPGLKVLYIVPTRALANDLYLRIHDQLITLELLLAIRTGDKRDFNPKEPSDFLITTPESLDSLICRQTLTFSSLQFVIVDEIHLIDGSYRGDQVRVLLKRLNLISKTPFKIYTLSATIEGIDETAGRYMTDFDIIRSEGAREIEYKILDSLEDALGEARKNKLLKILMFCNSRTEVELLSEECVRYWPKDKVVVHHGKLDRKIRSETETFFRDCKWGLCIATMTLEIGIDIGNIDVVFLYGPPWSVSSLLQRIGRGNRRKTTAIAYGICRKPEEHACFEEMFELAVKGRLEHKEYEFDKSVIVQQILSCLFQTATGLSEAEISELFNKFCDLDFIRLIIDNLVNNNLAEWRQNKICASDKLMDWGEKGFIHSNIANSKDYQIVNSVTNSILGNISTAFVEDRIRFAGRAWRVTQIKGVQIKVVPTESGTAPEFGHTPNQGAFSWLLPANMK